MVKPIAKPQRMTRAWFVGVLGTLALGLAACGDPNGGSSADPASTIEVEETEEPEYKSKDVDSIRPDNVNAQVEDPGYGVSFTYQGAVSASNGGTVVTIAVRNDNDVTLPPDAFDEPTLETGNGGGNYSKVDLLQSNPEDGEALGGLDLPLGVGATTNLQYVFDTTPGALWDARLTIGNVVYEGNLSN